MRLFRSQRGFTLPELVVTIFVFMVLLFVSSWLLRAYDPAPELRDAQRQIGLAEIAQGIKRYEASGQSFRTQLTDKDKTIGSGDDELDLCLALVPDFLKELPLDPAFGYRVENDTSLETDEACTSENVAYQTGYAIRLDKNGKYILSAVVPETTDKVSITF